MPAPTAAPSRTPTRERLQAILDDACRGMNARDKVVVAERVARELARTRRANRYPRPGDLARKIDPLATGDTPALQAIDDALVWAASELEAGRRASVGIAMPPQEGKSRRVTIAFPLWLLLRNPDLRIAQVSFESEVAAAFSTPVRNWIAEHGSGTAARPRALSDDLLGITLRGDSTSRSRFSIAGHQGGVIALGMKGGLTSRPVDVLIVDDPYKSREQADNPKHREMVEQWWRHVALPRLPAAALVIVVHTRWHPDDLLGFLVKQEATLPEHLRSWRFVSIPAQAETPRPDDPGWLPDALGRQPGEYMISARGRTAEDWAARRAEVGEMAWGSLYQQHPTPPEGAVFDYAHITHNRRPVDHPREVSRAAVAVDPSAGGSDEAGIIAGYRGRDSRVYVTHDRSGRMSAAAWARAAWLLVLDTGAHDLVWEQNLAGPTMRQTILDAWSRIVRQVRTLDAVRLATPGIDRAALLLAAAATWAAQEQRVEVGAVDPTDDDRAQLVEVLDRMDASLLAGALDTHPARLVPVTATTGKRVRATPVAVAYETGRVSHVGVLPELESELTQWQEGQPSPGRLDADVWLVTHLLAARRSRVSNSAQVALPRPIP